jgi:hypothetical protein
MNGLYRVAALRGFTDHQLSAPRYWGDARTSPRCAFESTTIEGRTHTSAHTKSFWRLQDLVAERRGRAASKRIR